VCVFWCIQMCFFNFSVGPIPFKKKRFRFLSTYLYKVLLDLHYSIQLACNDNSSNQSTTTTTIHEWPANRGLLSNSSRISSRISSSSGSPLGSNNKHSSSSPRVLLSRLACYRAAHERLCDSGSDLGLWRDCEAMQEYALGCRLRLVVESINEV